MRHTVVGPQHFLVGIAAVGGPAAEALAVLGATAETLRERAARSERRKLRPVKGTLHFNEEVRSLLADALREAFEAVSERIGPEHMLLAACRRDNAGARILAALGADRDRVTASLRPLIGEPYFVHKDPKLARDKLTPAAARSLVVGRAVARVTGHDRIDFWQSLVGALYVPGSLGPQAIAGLGVALTALRRDAAAERPRKAPPGDGKILLPSYVLAHALHEAADVGQRYVGTEHLVLAAFTDSQCAGFLSRYGVTRRRFTEALVQWRGRVTEPEIPSDVLIPREFFEEFEVPAG
jgi:ATP-dependent Clp protease ATP-binding subunit ClpA